MIKVTLGDNPKEVDVKPFPKLMVVDSAFNTGTIVLFTTYRKGVVMHGEGCWAASEGRYMEVWDMGQFTNYNEPITIQNA